MEWILFPSNSSVVSSANKIDTNLFETFGKKFTYTINNKDPSIYPRGTPHETVLNSELVSCQFTLFSINTIFE